MELDATEEFKRAETVKKSHVEAAEKTFTVDSGVREQCFKVTKSNETTQDRRIEKDMHISTMRQRMSFMETLSVEEQLVQVITEQARLIDFC